MKSNVFSCFTRLLLVALLTLLAVPTWAENHANFVTTTTSNADLKPQPSQMPSAAEESTIKQLDPAAQKIKDFFENPENQKRLLAELAKAKDPQRVARERVDKDRETRRLAAALAPLIAMPFVIWFIRRRKRKQGEKEILPK